MWLGATCHVESQYARSSTDHSCYLHVCTKVMFTQINAHIILCAHILTYINKAHIVLQYHTNLFT